MSEEWAVDTWRGQLVWKFPAGMSQRAFHTEEFADAWKAGVSKEGVDLVVTVFDMDEPFKSVTFERLQAMARYAAANGVEYWFVVADGAKKIAIKGRLSEVDDIVVHSEAEIKPALGKAKQLLD